MSLSYKWVIAKCIGDVYLSYTPFVKLKKIAFNQSYCYVLFKISLFLLIFFFPFILNPFILVVLFSMCFTLCFYVEMLFISLALCLF